MAEDKSQKTEKPTPQRRKQAARTGRCRAAGRHRWLAVLSFSFLAPMTVDRLRGTFETLMTRVPEVIARPEAGSAVEVLGLAAGGAAGAAAPMLLAAAGVALAGGGRPGRAEDSPPSGSSRSSSTSTRQGHQAHGQRPRGVGAAKILLKIAVLGVVAWVVLRGAGERIMGGGSGRCPRRSGPASRPRSRSCAWPPSSGSPSRALDYLMERRRVEKGMRMSQDEIKREHRQSEGDPHQKGALRGRQREIAATG